MVTFISYWIQREETWMNIGLEVREPESSPATEAVAL